jgi:hypothetical protein
MANVQIGMPVFEATGPDGNVEIWAVAAGHDEALKIIQERLPGCTIRESFQRKFGPRMEGFRYGEARRVFP